MAATASVTVQEDAWVQISTNKVFTLQNTSGMTILVRSDTSLPAASVAIGFRLIPGEMLQNNLTTKTWYATIESKGDDTATVTIDEV